MLVEICRNITKEPNKGCQESGKRDQPRAPLVLPVSGVGQSHLAAPDRAALISAVSRAHGPGLRGELDPQTRRGQKPATPGPLIPVTLFPKAAALDMFKTILVFGHRVSIVLSLSGAKPARHAALPLARSGEVTAFWRTAHPLSQAGGRTAHPCT